MLDDEQIKIFQNLIQKEDLELVDDRKELYMKYKHTCGSDYAEGFINGLSDGMAGAKFLIARRLKLLGFSNKKIQDIIDLSDEEISCF